MCVLTLVRVCPRANMNESRMKSCVCPNVYNNVSSCKEERVLHVSRVCQVTHSPNSMSDSTCGGRGLLKADRLSTLTKQMHSQHNAVDRRTSVPPGGVTRTVSVPRSNNLSRRARLVSEVAQEY